MQQKGLTNVCGSKKLISNIYKALSFRFTFCCNDFAAFPDCSNYLREHNVIITEGNYLKRRGSFKKDYTAETQQSSKLTPHIPFGGDAGRQSKTPSGLTFIALLQEQLIPALRSPSQLPLNDLNAPG